MCTFRQKLAIVSCLGLFTATAAMAEQTGREWQSCNNADNDTRIAACTGILDKGGRESNKMRANAYANRGIAFGNKGQHERAIQDFDEALRLDPQNAVMYNNRGWAFTNRGDIDRGIRDFDEAIRLDPKLAIGFNSRGSSYNIKGDYDRAIQDLDEALRLNPRFASALINRGRSYTSKGAYDRAVRASDRRSRRGGAARSKDYTGLYQPGPCL